ncbi:MAG TPA: DNA methyltransferase [Prosthecobacter sp.]|nr:DNA methyltransferase [Prosthecobacter sp.]
MKPYYSEGGIEIYCGESGELLPSLIHRANCFATDPPWGINGGRGGRARFRKGDYRSDWPDTPEYISSVCIPVVRQLIDAGLPGAVTPGHRCYGIYPQAVSMGCFWQPCAVGFEPWGQCVMQPILYYGKDPRAGKGQSPTGRQVTEHPPKIGHPCPKPQKAWNWLVRKVGLPGWTIIDPFGGGGATAVAAQGLGMGAILIDREERYCETAANRLSQGVLDFSPSGVTPQESSHA